ncbi:hypothetical protein [Crassaminicella profunda]|uniref:hypothetical protein n=1 Tax=Crassaminicella profunda TaxID=1286698 RepID=UPI001CA68C36|nr:hypothetical protein [Crassaminicella profunda]QZY54124.1 hypothetical protein K7H06_13845 [Crassaminicella profunda]
MKIKLGVIGPSDSIEKICKIAKEVEEKVIIFPYVYENKEETLELINECQKKVDGILFSGHVPYNIAKFSNALTKPAVYIPRVGTSILKALWEIKCRGIDYTKMSIDSVKEKSVKEIADELEIKFDEMNVIPYEENISYDELVKYHYNLWKNKRINVAVTGLSKTYIKLKELGVTVHKLSPTTFLMREYLNKAIYKASVKKIKATQIAIAIVKIKNENNNMSSEYEFLKIKNKLEEMLINFTKNSFGSIFPFGRDEYLIFTTRGALDNEYNTQEFKKYFKTDRKSNIVFASGIGYGNTVYNAEYNARVALNRAMGKEYSCIYMVDEDGSITGPISSENENTLTYNITVSDERIQSIASKLDISASYVSKIMAIIEKTNKNTFDSEELSNYLEISSRSGRRILKKIVDTGFGKIIGKESKTKSGRPKQIYEIFM